MEELKKEIAGMLEAFKGQIPTVEQVKALEDKIKSLPDNDLVQGLKTELDEIRKAAKAQGEYIVMMQKSHTASGSKSLSDMLKSEYGQELIKGVKEKTRQAEFEVKAADTVSTGNVAGPSDPTLSLLGANGERFFINRSQGDSILSAVRLGSTDKAALTWVDEVEGEGAVAGVPEGTEKPPIDIKFVEKISNAIKVAGRVKVTEEALTDISYMEGAIIQVLVEKLGINIENDVIDGIFAEATTYSLADYNGKVTNANMMDAINAAIAQSSLSGFTPTTIALNPVDVMSLRFIKTTEGLPVLSWFNEGRFPVLNNGLRIFMNKKVPKGEFALGDFSKYRVDMYTRKVVWGWENDDFTKNLRTVIAEARYHKRISSNEKTTLVKGVFATIIAAINK